MAFWSKPPLARHGALNSPTGDLPYRVGQGNWQAFEAVRFDINRVYDAAEGWSRALSGIEKPWLCWNIDSDWCLAQQRLVTRAGWTPVIGFDPRVGPPRDAVPGAVAIDFNKGLNLPVMYPHFVMEFAFLIADRLAFWHSDLLVRLPLFLSIAKEFDNLRDGETMVTKNPRSRRQVLTGTHKRHWELIGCTTRAASRSQFENGAGWWMGFAYHPSCPATDRIRRLKEYWDHGAGIFYWNKRCGGRVKVIRGQDIHEGHCTMIGNPNYRRSVPINTSDAKRNMMSELAAHFDLTEVCQRLQVSEICLDGKSHIRDRSSQQFTA